MKQNNIRGLAVILIILLFSVGYAYAEGSAPTFRDVGFKVFGRYFDFNGTQAANVSNISFNASYNSSASAHYIDLLDNDTAGDLIFRSKNANGVLTERFRIKAKLTSAGIVFADDIDMGNKNITNVQTINSTTVNLTTLNATNVNGNGSGLTNLNLSNGTDVLPSGSYGTGIVVANISDYESNLTGRGYVTNTTMDKTILTSRPASPVNGSYVLNLTHNLTEVYANGIWHYSGNGTVKD